MEKMLISGLFKLLGYRLSRLSADSLKNKKKQKLVDVGGPPIKYAYQAFIIQNLDIVTLELGMKVQYANF
jgi:hypothetical protein